jgi:hypothetical protein
VRSYRIRNQRKDDGNIVQEPVIVNIVQRADYAQRSAGTPGQYHILFYFPGFFNKTRKLRFVALYIANDEFRRDFGLLYIVFYCLANFLATGPEYGIDNFRLIGNTNLNDHHHKNENYQDDSFRHSIFSHG